MYRSGCSSAPVFSRLLLATVLAGCKKTPTPIAPTPPTTTLRSDAGVALVTGPVRDGVHTGIPTVVIDGGTPRVAAVGRLHGDAGTMRHPTVDVPTIVATPSMQLPDPHSRVAGGSIAMGALWRTDGSVYSWLEPGGTAPSTAQLVVHLPTANSFAGGAGGTGCALMADHKVQCWGSNANGQLGSGMSDYDNHTDPVVVPNVEHAVQIAASSGEVCAVLEDHTVKCWGRRSIAATNVAPPTPVLNLKNVHQVALGEGVFCAALENGTVQCLGDNHWGIVEPGKRTTYDAEGNLPPSIETAMTVPGLTDVTAVALSDTHGCVRRKDATVTCWGGAYGDTPVVVAGVANVTSLSCVSVFEQVAGGTEGMPTLFDVHGLSCAVVTDGTLTCWTSEDSDDYTASDPGGRRKVNTPAVVAELKGVVGVNAGAVGSARSVLTWMKDGALRLVDFSVAPPKISDPTVPAPDAPDAGGMEDDPNEDNEEGDNTDETE